MKSWMIRFLALCGLALIAACGSEQKAPAPKVEAGQGPALWRVERAGLDGWIFGTIHVLRTIAARLAGEGGR